MDGDISLATSRRFIYHHVPAWLVWKSMRKCRISWRGATLGKPRSITAASPGNFSRTGVSQLMGLHHSSMAHTYHGAEYDVTGVTASWTVSTHAAEEGISTTS
jgi:hypothetical protein